MLGQTDVRVCCNAKASANVSTTSQGHRQSRTMTAGSAAACVIFTHEALMYDASAVVPDSRWFQRAEPNGRNECNLEG